MTKAASKGRETFQYLDSFPFTILRALVFLGILMDLKVDMQGVSLERDRCFGVLLRVFLCLLVDVAGRDKYLNAALIVLSVSTFSIFSSSSKAALLGKKYPNVASSENAWKPQMRPLSVVVPL